MLGIDKNNKGYYNKPMLNVMLNEVNWEHSFKWGMREGCSFILPSEFLTNVMKEPQQTILIKLGAHT